MPITGLTSASEPKHTQKGKKVPGETSHGLLPTYLVWNEDQGGVVPLKGKESLTRNQGETHYQGIKNAILIGEVLVHESYIFGKRGSNVTCGKKPHPNWPNGLRDMAF